MSVKWRRTRFLSSCQLPSGELSASFSSYHDIFLCLELVLFTSSLLPYSTPLFCITSQLKLPTVISSKLGQLGHLAPRSNKLHHQASWFLPLRQFSLRRHFSIPPVHPNTTHAISHTPSRTSASRTTHQPSSRIDDPLRSQSRIPLPTFYKTLASVSRHILYHRFC